MLVPRLTVASMPCPMIGLGRLVGLMDAEIVLTFCLVMAFMMLTLRVVGFVTGTVLVLTVVALVVVVVVVVVLFVGVVLLLVVAVKVALVVLVLEMVLADVGKGVVKIRVMAFSVLLFPFSDGANLFTICTDWDGLAPNVDSNLFM